LLNSFSSLIHVRFMGEAYGCGNKRSIPEMFQNSKRLVGLILGLVLVMGVFLFTAAAQQSSKNDGSLSVTGCLQKGGDAPGEFSITGNDGKVYGLRSSSVNLADHVGHTVTVTGNLKAEGKDEDEDEARESKEGGKKETGDIQVSKLKMVSESCK
jgi:hypothetical protein